MLQRHKNNKYYLRFIIPKDCYKLFKSKEILKSLKTTSKYQAKILHNKFIKRIETRFTYNLH